MCIMRGDCIKIGAASLLETISDIKGPSDVIDIFGGAIALLGYFLIIPNTGLNSMENRGTQGDALR